MVNEVIVGVYKPIVYPYFGGNGLKLVEFKVKFKRPQTDLNELDILIIKNMSPTSSRHYRVVS